MTLLSVCLLTSDIEVEPKHKGQFGTLVHVGMYLLTSNPGAICIFFCLFKKIVFTRNAKFLCC